MKGKSIFCLLSFSLIISSLVAQKNYAHFEHFDTTNGLPSSFINSIEEDIKGNLWAGTQHGLCMINKESCTVFLKDEKDTTSISDNIINCVTADKSGFLWIGTENGLNKFDPSTGKSERLLFNQRPNPANAISAIAIEGSRTVWIGTMGNGLFAYSRQTGRIKHFIHDKNKNSSLSGNKISAIYIDHSNNIWIGTKGDGLNLFNPKTDGFITFRHNTKDSCSIAGDVINTIFSDGHDRLWVGTTTGLSCISNAYYSKGKFCNLFVHSSEKKESISSNNVISIAQDSYGQLWFGTNGDGVNRFVQKYSDQLENSHFTTIKMDKSNASGLSGNVVKCLLNDHSGNFWMGTNHGLNKFNTSLQAVQEVGVFFRNIAKDINKTIFPEEEEESKNDSLPISGIFQYSKSFSGGGLKIILLDDENNPLDSAITNDQGRFEFNRLLPEKEYIISVEEKDILLSSQARILILNANGEVIQKVLYSGGGYFNYKTLDRQQYASLPVLENVQSDLLTINVYGQVYKKLPGDFSDSMTVMIINDKGETMYITKTGYNGTFVFRHLPPDATYSFKLKDDSENLVMAITDKNRKLIQKIIKDQKNVFRYERLSMSDASVIHLLNEDDVMLTVRANERFVMKNIYYDYNRYELNESSKKELNHLILLLNKNKYLGVTISSHTDCRGDDQYNLELSQKRADACIQYLVDKGIEAKKLKSEGNGETQLVNRCSNGVDCTEEEHAQNRRTEFRLIKMK